MVNHDGSYKYLFSHARMVEDLLKGFVKEEWVEKLDFSTLEKVNGSYVSDDLRERTDDVVWRIRWGEDWLYVYLLLEFQSTIDPWMAVRIMTYVGLLYQDLIQAGRIVDSGRLPPVLPVVLYNGDSEWTAATDIAQLVVDVPGGLSRYRPQLQYLLLAERNYSDEELKDLKNLVATLFRLENSQSSEHLLKVVTALLQWLSGVE
ncbi:MAG: Rpn family recombination-promoting nuclease/putative transposase, partial [Thermodesulfobacteriota bacterium]|nr:Rpn family recombination-promoting nuclease/putative transposase [Thermodesulfobacteriota bacterium]